jgi:hypothetical protein
LFDEPDDLVDEVSFAVEPDPGEQQPFLKDVG